MANEGSTKPTYSELEAELLRVRGLLQRLEWSASDGDGCSMCPVCKAEGGVPVDPHADDCWLAKELSTNFPQSSSLVPQGAESADIGKLDSADKSGKAALTIVEEWTQCPTSFHFMGLLVQFQNELVGLRKFKKYVHDRLDAAGVNKHEEQDAITGCRIGSRLDDVLRLSEDASRSSEARPGVYGAVESKTVDKSGSREPEKLNNAPLSDEQLLSWIAVEMFEDDWDEPRPLWEDLPEADRNSYIKMAGAALRVFRVSMASPEELDMALAESSLSSPPPTFQEWVVEQEGNERILRRYYQSQHLMKRDVAIFCDWNGPEDVKADEKRVMELLACPTFRQSSSPMNPGPESAHSGKQNAADKSGLLPTQLPKEK